MTWLDDVQRRLALAGARGLGHQVADQIGRAIRGESADVWETATTEDPADADMPPECAWCPVCRAIRAARGASANPDLASRVSGTADAVMAVAYDMVASVDAALSRLPGPVDARQHPQPTADAARSAGTAHADPAPSARTAPRTGAEPRAGTETSADTARSAGPAPRADSAPSAGTPPRAGAAPRAGTKPRARTGTKPRARTEMSADTAPPADAAPVADAAPPAGEGPRPPTPPSPNGRQG